MTDPSTRAIPDPAAAGIHEHIERLKATEERLSGLLSACRDGSDVTATTGMTSTPDIDPPAPSRHTSRGRWRRRID